MEEGKWTQLLVSFWATRFQSSSVIYCTRTLILREICHNTKSARCVPPVEEALPRPLGHPVKQREIYSLSYLGSYHLTLTEREGTERPWLKITKLNASEAQTVCNCVQLCVCVLVNEWMSVCVCVRSYTVEKRHSESGAAECFVFPTKIWMALTALSWEHPVKLQLELRKLHKQQSLYKAGLGVTDILACFSSVVM